MEERVGGVLGLFFFQAEDGIRGVAVTGVQTCALPICEVIHVMGRVLNVEGQPVRGARVELWQANAHGRYTHPSDTNSAPLDPNFEGFAVQTTDAEGRYRFKTIKPGAYPANPNWMRPPHLHFEVTGKVNRLVTQLYFPGEARTTRISCCRTCARTRTAPSRR